MNRIFKKIWNRHRGCFVAVSEAMTAAGQRAGKATVVVGTVGLMFSGLVQATDEYIHEGDYYKRDHSGPYENTQDFTKAPHMVITGNYFHLGDNPHTDGEDHAYVAANDNQGRGFANSTLDVYGDITITGQEGIWTVLDIGWSHYCDNANGTLNVSGNVLIDGNGGLAGIGVAGIYEGSGNHNATGRLNIAGDLTIKKGGSVTLITGGTEDLDGTITATVKTKSLNLYSSVLSYPNLFENKTIISDNEWGDAVIYNGGYFSTPLSTNGSLTNAFNNLTLESGSIFINSSDLILGNKTTGATTIASTLNLNGGSVSDLTNLIQRQGALNVNSGSYQFGTLNKTDGTLSNKSSLSITNFNQSGGTTANTGTLTIGNSNLYGSLTSTGTLNLTGSVTSRGNLSSSGTLNNQGTWTEANAFNIAGTLNNTGTVNFQNGFSFASNGKLNSSGTVKTSNASNIFDSLGSMTSQELKYVSLGASTPQAVRTSLNNFFRKYLPGTVSQTLAQNASFTGGKIVITGVNLTTTQRDDLVKAFKAQFFEIQNED